MVVTQTSGAPRNTRQRGEVLALLEEIDDFRTPQQLHVDLLQRGAKVGLTTVYRTLQLLVDAGRRASSSIAGVVGRTTITWCAAAARRPSRWRVPRSSGGPTGWPASTDSPT
jgi:hypothetical protein